MQRHAAALLSSARRLQTFRRLSSNNDAALRPAASREGLTEAFWTGSSLCQQRGSSCQHRGMHANTPPASLEPSAFRDYRAVFSQASTTELLRAWVVFRMCGVRSFVNNGQALMTLSNRILGPNLTTALIKHTFFRHFCGGASPAFWMPVDAAFAVMAALLELLPANPLLVLLRPMPVQVKATLRSSGRSHACRHKGCLQSWTMVGVWYPL